MKTQTPRVPTAADLDFKAAIEADAEIQLKRLGFDDKFLAIWRFYLHYCEVGFDAKRTDVVHLELGRPA